LPEQHLQVLRRYLQSVQVLHLQGVRDAVLQDVQGAAA
jgi:hypothetical protein